jgi:hypothetical protein
MAKRLSASLLSIIVETVEPPTMAVSAPLADKKIELHFAGGAE